jgi:hypothetical protein
VLDALLDAGADIEATGAVLGGGSPLAHAYGFGNWAAARRLVERGARTRLSDAAALGLLDRVKAFFAQGSGPDPQVVTQAFWSACHVASGIRPSTFSREAPTSTGSDGTTKRCSMWSMRPPHLILLGGFEHGVRCTRRSSTVAKPDARLSQIPRHAVPARNWRAEMREISATSCDPLGFLHAPRRAHPAARAYGRGARHALHVRAAVARPVPPRAARTCR